MTAPAHHLLHRTSSIYFHLLCVVFLVFFDNWCSIFEHLFLENIKEIVLQMEDFVWILQRILRLRVYKSLSILSRWQKSQYFAILTSRSLVVERIVIRCPDD